MDTLKFKHYIIGENKLCFPEYEYIIKLDFPRVYIKYKLLETYFSDYDEFFDSFAEVQWLDGEEPKENIKTEIFVNAYNFLCIDERLLEQDLEDFDDELEDI